MHWDRGPAGIPLSATPGKFLHQSVRDYIHEAETMRSKTRSDKSRWIVLAAVVSPCQFAIEQRRTTMRTRIPGSLAMRLLTSAFLTTCLTLTLPGIVEASITYSLDQYIPSQDIPPSNPLRPRRIWTCRPRLQRLRRYATNEVVSRVVTAPPTVWIVSRLNTEPTGSHPWRPCSFRAFA